MERTKQLLNIIFETHFDTQLKQMSNTKTESNGTTKYNVGSSRQSYK